MDCIIETHCVRKGSQKENGGKRPIERNSAIQTTYRMPAKSRKQQMAAGAALAAKRGKQSRGSLRGASRQMAESMSEGELRKMAHTKRKTLPKRASRERGSRRR
jgi:hypothetical protein